MKVTPTLSQSPPAQKRAGVTIPIRESALFVRTQIFPVSIRTQVVPITVRAGIQPVSVKAQNMTGMVVK